MHRHRRYSTCRGSLLLQQRQFGATDYCTSTSSPKLSHKLIFNPIHLDTSFEGSRRGGILGPGEGAPTDSALRSSGTVGDFRTGRARCGPGWLAGAPLLLLLLLLLLLQLLLVLLVLVLLLLLLQLLLVLLVLLLLIVVVLLLVGGGAGWRGCGGGAVEAAGLVLPDGALVVLLAAKKAERCAVAVGAPSLRGRACGCELVWRVAVLAAQLNWAMRPVLLALAAATLATGQEVDPDAAAAKLRRGCGVSHRRTVLSREQPANAAVLRAVAVTGTSPPARRRLRMAWTTPTHAYR